MTQIVKDVCMFKIVTICVVEALFIFRQGDRILYTSTNTRGNCYCSIPHPCSKARPSESGPGPCE
jgi:hypothetical protein